MNIISLQENSTTSMQEIFDSFPTIHENQMTLRKVRLNDAEDLVDLYDFPMKTETVKRMIQNYETCYEERKEVLIGFTWKEKICGVLELYHFKDDACELGYRTCLRARKKGITKKAVSLLLKELKNTELHKLYACCERNHHASMAILEDNGFRITKIENQKCWYQYDLTIRGYHLDSKER